MKWSRSRRSAATPQLVAAITLGLIALAGCSHPSEEASDLPTPEVVWAANEPTDPEWDSPWAGAYLEASIQWAEANAYGDFSDPDLIAAVGYDTAWQVAERASDQRFDPESGQRRLYEHDAVNAFWGTIIDVEVAPDDLSAVITGCRAAVQGGTDLVPYPDFARFTLTDAGTFEFDGSYRPDDASAATAATACGDAKIWVAKWATPIDIDDVGRDTVKMPLPRQYYIDLGVITQ